MRLLILALILCGAFSACTDSTTSPSLNSPPDVDPQPPTEPGRLIVYVYWDGGSPQKRIEVVEAIAADSTNDDGLAEFELAPGVYTVNAWVGVPGPGGYPRVYTTTVRSGETTRLEVFDCVPCV